MHRSALFASALLLLPHLSACTTSTQDTAITVPDGGSGGGGVEVILDGGGTPATPPNGAMLCPQGECNYQTGAGCPAASPACIPTLNGSAASPGCEPAGTGTTGVACTQPTDCAAGYYCAAGQCHKLCCGHDWTGCDSPSEHCLEDLSFGGPNGSVIPTGAMLCYPVNTCNALMPASCTTPGTTCQLADPTGATACLPEGTGGPGAACPCMGGFTCLKDPKTGEQSCHRLCGAVEGGAPPYCQEGEGICVHYVNDPAGVGECVANP